MKQERDKKGRKVSTVLFLCLHSAFLSTVAFTMGYTTEYSILIRMPLSKFKGQNSAWDTGYMLLEHLFYCSYL